MDSQRQRISQIDRILIQIIEERIEVGKEIAEIKKQKDLPIENSEQEKKVIERAQDRTDLDVEDVFRDIIELTKTQMQK